MLDCRIPIPAQTVLAACALALALGPAGCTSSAPPAAAPAAESAEVHCDACGRRVARQSAQPRISPEGLDVYVCQQCVARVRQGKPLSSPSARVPGKRSSRGTP
jgi:hypothetical protein